VDLPHIFENSFLTASHSCITEPTFVCNNLVSLSLRSIRFRVLNLPEDVATCLSGLTRLETLILQFCSVHLRSLRTLTSTYTSAHAFCPPHTHPAGVPSRSYYLERLVARIDAPLLLRLYISFLHNDIFDVHNFVDSSVTHRSSARSLKQGCIITRTNPYLISAHYHGQLMTRSSCSISQEEGNTLHITRCRLWLGLRILFPSHLHRGRALHLRVSHYYHDPDDRRNQRNDWAELLDLFTSLTTLFLKVGNGGMPHQ